jgi:hypothetical protein
MIRPFDWRDVGLVRTLSGTGVCLDSEIGLTRGSRSLRRALLDYLLPGTGAPTLVWRAETKNAEPVAFGQLHHRPGDEQAHVLLIAPRCAPENPAWLKVVEQLAVAAGKRGAHNLIAEVDEDSCEFEALRSAGFAIYARQTLWQLTRPLAAAPEASLRPAVSADAFGVSVLYSNVVPRLVQQVEPPPARLTGGYVLTQGSEVTAYLDVRRGPLGVWVEPCLHPEAYALSESVMRTGLRLIAAQTPKPVYVCVRRHHDWLVEILERAGLQPLGAQAVLVKRLTAGITEHVLKPLPVVEGGAATPAVRIQFGGFERDNRHWWNYAETNYRRLARPAGGHPRADWPGPHLRQPNGRPARSHPRPGPRTHRPLH